LFLKPVTKLISKALCSAFEREFVVSDRAKSGQQLEKAESVRPFIRLSGWGEAVPPRRKTAKIQSCQYFDFLC